MGKSDLGKRNSEGKDPLDPTTDSERRSFQFVFGSLFVSIVVFFTSCVNINKKRDSRPPS